MNNDYLNYANSITYDQYKYNQPLIKKEYRMLGGKFVDKDFYTTITMKNADLMQLLRYVKERIKFESDFQTIRLLVHIYDVINEGLDEK